MANKTVAILLGLLALSSTAWATVAITPTSPSTTSSSFTTTPVKIMDYTNTTDATNWASMVTPNGAYFGQGPNSTLVNLWGVEWSSTATPPALTKAVKRIINATATADGTDTEATTVVSSETTVSLSAATATAPSMFGSAADVLFIATTGLDAAAGNSQVYVTVINGTTATKVTIGVATVVAASGTTYQQYTYSIMASMVVDSTFYVMWSSSQQCVANTGTCATASTTTASFTDIYVQGVWGNGTAVWTTAAHPYTSTYSATVVAAPAGGAALSANMVSSATSLYAAFRLTAASSAEATAGTVQYSTITISSGSAGSATTLVTDVLSSSTVAAGYIYSPIGGFGSYYTYGIGLGVQYLGYAAAAITTTGYGVSICYNASTTATSIANFTSAVATPVGVMGTAFGNTTLSGYALAMSYTSSLTSSTPTTVVWQEFYPNGTAVQTSPTTFGTVGTSSYNSFLDQSNNLWFGYTSYDTTTSPYYITQAYLGKLIGSVYSYGNFLTSTVAFLLFVVATLFTF